MPSTTRSNFNRSPGWRDGYCRKKGAENVNYLVSRRLAELSQLRRSFKAGKKKKKK
ncbi:MAG: hypothetical protein U1F27_09290 [Turneriella sp.]